MKKPALKEKREVRIYNGRGNNYGKPLLMLQGNWLQEFGFLVGDRVTITCQNNRLVIENSGERAAAHMVAEPGVEYGAEVQGGRERQSGV